MTWLLWDPYSATLTAIGCVILIPLLWWAIRRDMRNKHDGMRGLIEATLDEVRRLADLYGPYRRCKNMNGSETLVKMASVDLYNAKDSLERALTLMKEEKR